MSLYHDDRRKALRRAEHFRKRKLEYDRLAEHRRLVRMNRDERIILGCFAIVVLIVVTLGAIS